MRLCWAPSTQVTNGETNRYGFTLYICTTCGYYYRWAIITCPLIKEMSKGCIFERRNRASWCYHLEAIITCLDYCNFSFYHRNVQVSTESRNNFATFYQYFEGALHILEGSRHASWFSKCSYVHSMPRELFSMVWGITSSEYSFFQL